jgi:hypothetical protein
MSINLRKVEEKDDFDPYRSINMDFSKGKPGADSDDTASPTFRFK